MRNFFRPVWLVVAVVFCMLCGLPAVSAFGFDAPLDEVGDVSSGLDAPMEPDDVPAPVSDVPIEPDVALEPVSDVPMASDDAFDLVLDVPMESDDAPEPVSDVLMESDDAPDLVPDVPIESDDAPEPVRDGLVQSEGASGLSQSAFASGAGALVEFQSNSLLAVPSGVSGGNGSLSLLSSSDSDGNAQDALLALFGPYTPRMQTVTTYYNGEVISTEEQVVPGIAGLDFEWLVSVGLFALMLWCLFRILGGLLKHG